MPLEHFVGDRSPSLTYTVELDGQPFDLTGSTVKFRMRLETSSALKVDAAAVVVQSSPSVDVGEVRYDWAALDVDTPGDYVGWFVITLPGGKTMSTPPFPIVLADLAAAAPAVYVTREELKETLELTGQRFADADIDRAIVAASRGIDKAFGRRFYPGATNTEVRYYTPRPDGTVEIDDLVELTELATDPAGLGTYETVWTVDTDFWLEPANAVVLGEPWHTIRLNPAGRDQSFMDWPRWSFADRPRSVRVTGRFGWAATPAAVELAASLIATKLVRRAREAPFGIVGVGLEGAAVRISRYDPDLAFLRDTVTRTTLFV